ncbi:SDR family oxidoreductase [Kineococcus rhizosphaerae]|uniref:3-oxoacyl-[acyl-carrier protein] reductase n=1 Tax=Kineococcus rhizosphaerae TaxID=559628 RepID=A0A2T0QUZ5_9ACTN|nr:SDR family oxidoreductase [Kineococcus rhizosphaerae]PRY08945.1 3-oxoacyl-[acyl-carrier protein] reductase [Kineococcus rhizosphaerae]
MSAPLLQGRRALVVGGGGEIGAAVAELFAVNGAAVVVADRPGTIASRTITASSRFETVDIDVTDQSSTRAAVAAATALLGGHVEIVVNSAGILEQVAVREMTLAQWQRTIDIDLTGTFLVAQAVLDPMLQAGWGRIINVGSQLGLLGGQTLAHYAAAKAGVIGFTKSLAREVASQGVLVNTIAPGPIDTEMTARVDEAWKKEKRADLPLGRFGTPAEVAPTALLLASDPGGNLYVGQTLGPNSGDVMP